MHKIFRIVLWFLVGLFIALVTSIALFLPSVSPLRAEFAIEAVTIAANSQTPVRMTWRDFTCGSGDRCTIPLPTGDLTVTVPFQDNGNGFQILKCEATHAGKKIDCQGNLGNSAGGVRFLGRVFVDSSLGLNQNQLQALRQKNWYAQWDQHNPIWSIATAVFSIAFGLLSGVLLWQYPARSVRILAAIVVGMAAFYFLALAPLNLHYIINIVGFSGGGEPNPGFPPLLSYYLSGLFMLFSRLYVFDSSGLIKLAIFGAIVAALTLAMLWRRTEPKMPPMFAVLGGGSALFLFSVFAYGFLIAYGFVQADY